MREQNHTLIHSDGSSKANAYFDNKMGGKGFFSPEHTPKASVQFSRNIIQKSETDAGDASLDLGTLADSAAGLNAEVNRIIEEVRVELSVIRPMGRAYIPFGGIAPLNMPSAPRPINPRQLVNLVFIRLGTASTIARHLTIIGSWACSNLPNRSLGANGYASQNNKYSGGGSWHFNYLAPIFKMAGVNFGGDKIDHFFQQGFSYYTISNTMGKGADYARAWGEWTEGRLSAEHQSNPELMAWLQERSQEEENGTGVTGQRQGGFGLAATGVYSRGDLAANNAGMRFYQELFNNPTGYQFNISNYVNADWNEEISGNIYRNDLGSQVRNNGRLNPMDTILAP